jgi:uncharacterized protein YhbP (UPF0306 family)
MNDQSTNRKWARDVCIEYLASYNVLSLATVSPDKLVWVALVNYVFEKAACAAYFISKPNSLHSVNIKSNNRVSIAVTDTSQDLDNSPHGLQARGYVYQVIDSDKGRVQGIYARVFPRYATRLSSIEDPPVAYRLVPSYCKLVDSRLSADPIEAWFDDGPSK